MDTKPSIVFVTGGVRSGKTSFAEKYAIEVATKHKQKLHYLATAVVTDEEMKERVERHRSIRKTMKVQWETWEKSVDIHEIHTEFNNRDVILLDCLTTLVNNELFHNRQEWMDETVQLLILQKIKEGIVSLAKECGTLMVVSNEITYEAMEEPLIIAYSKLLNSLHQFVVQMADEAFLVEHSIPTRKKGEKK